MSTVQEVFGLLAPPVHNTDLPGSPAITSNPELLIGLELEIEALPRGKSLYEKLAGKAWTVVEDGSLRPHGEAWEFVSKPMPMNKALSETICLWDVLGLGPDSNNNYSDRTSVHVHCNVLDFTQEQLATLCLVYTCVEEVLFRFVNYYNVNKDEHPYGMCRDTNLYRDWETDRKSTRLNSSH